MERGWMDGESQETTDFTIDMHIYDSREERKLRIERLRLAEGYATPVGTLYQAVVGRQACVESALTLDQVRAALLYRRSIAEVPGHRTATGCDPESGTRDSGGTREAAMWAARLPAEARYLSRRVQLFANADKISRHDVRPLSEFSASTTHRIEIECPSKDSIVLGLHSTSTQRIDWMFCDRQLSSAAFTALVEATLGRKIVGQLLQPDESVDSFVARVGVAPFGLLDISIYERDLKELIQITLPSTAV